MASFRYALRDTFRLVFRHWGLSVLTLLTAGAVIYLLGMSALFSLNVRSMVSKVESELVVQAYLKDDSKIQQTVKEIKTIPYVTQVKAVSPEVTGHAITPSIASAPPNLPSKVVEIVLTTQPCPPLAVICVFNSPVLPKKAIAAAAQIKATTPSAIIEP
ncbi:hypothetical protein SDC9_158371 [bioreactor metagenome]|uniref:Cell division protein FtsX n=1 Tax=bioreactor metagenome TaxID=1076179 RepID=A0A645FAX8_9ZZZZ